MKQKNKLSGAALCGAIATTTWALLAAPDDWRIVAADQNGPAAVILSGGTTSAFGCVGLSPSARAASASILWRWDPARDPNVRSEDARAFRNIDECKVCDFGATLLVNASAGGVAAIDIATTQVVWYAKATRGMAGPHSVARLPDGRVAVANSTGCDALEIIDVRRFPRDPTRQTRVRAAEVAGAHGADWNARRHSLFVLGYTNLYEYAYLPETSTLRELHRWRFDVVARDPWGHDLTPDAQGGYFMTNESGVWRFDPERGTFTPVREERNVKSFSRDSRKGDLMQIPTERWWSDRLVVAAPDGTTRTIGPVAGAKFYKARWFQADARQLTWRDEFDGTSLDVAHWSRCKVGKSPWDRHMSPRADLVTVTNGTLVMVGVKNDDTKADPRPYLTGGVSSRGKGTLRVGKVEMRVKFEDQKGAWPALWMCGDVPDDLGRHWPWNGEIDIVERLNADPFVHHTVHSGWTFAKKRKVPRHHATAPIRQGDWNIYGLEITPDALVWSVNGSETFRYSRLADACDPDHWPFAHPFFFYLDMQLGGDWVGAVDAATLPVRMYVDWIRVYE